jgi:hypothetical protein
MSSMYQQRSTIPADPENDPDVATHESAAPIL